jgi:cytochrome c556
MRRLLIAVAVLLVASLAIPLAQQPPPQQPQPQQPQQQQPAPPAGGTQGRGGRGGAPNATPGAPPKPLVPVAASTVVNNPDQFVGEYVSLTAPVESLLTKSAFAVDQDKTKTEKDILIIAPTLQNAPEANAYVTVLGELVKFDPDDVNKKTKAKNYTVDLSPEQIAHYKGKPAVIATAVVVNASGVDIAKVIPPPMTPEELEFQKIMRQVGPANTALRAAIDKMDAAAVKEQAAILSTAFTKTEAFWKTKNKPEAVGIAAEAKKHSDAITAAVAAPNWEAVKASSGPLGQQCAACHGTYRERLDDGSFRIKMGSSSR